MFRQAVVSYKVTRYLDPRKTCKESFILNDPSHGAYILVIKPYLFSPAKFSVKKATYKFLSMIGGNRV